ncbi:MAG: LysE family translocator [Maribacter sp.]
MDTIGIINFDTFIVAVLLVTITPGASTLFILNQSISKGRKAGVFAAIGITLGALVHCIALGLGLSAILSNSVIIFEAIKYAGAGYLVYLGLKSVFAPSFSNTISEESNINFKSGHVLLSGILTDVLNPKVALFFLAFIPQFIEPGRVDNLISLLFLGLIFVIIGGLWCLFLALFSSKVSIRLKKNSKTGKWLNYLTGTIFISLGLKLAVFKK